MEDEINFDDENEFQGENETPKKYIKKINPNKTIEPKLKSKSQKRTKLILNTDNDLTNNSIVNTNFISKPIDLSYFSKFPGFFNRNFNLTTFKKQKEESRSHSKSPEKIRLPNHMRGNGIPNNINERLKFLNNIFKNEKFQKVYKKSPKRNEYNFEDLLDYILNYSKKNTIINAILFSFYYICHEIKYDYDFKERDEDFKRSQKPENVYESGLALSLGFTNIFEAILKKLDIKFKHIEGYCKYLPKDNNNLNKSKINKNNMSTFTMYNNSTTSSIFNNSSKILSRFNNEYYDTETEKVYEYINHCWNAFYYKGEWYLADTLLGSGSYELDDMIKEPNQFKSKDPNENFNLFYILSWPNYLIYSHFPAENNWQLTDKIWNFKQFLNKYNLDYPIFYKGITKYNVELLTHNDPFIQIMNKDNLEVKIKAVDYILEGNLYNPTNGQKISEAKNSFEQKTKIFTFEPVFPKCGDYLMRINLRIINSNDLSYRLLFNYRIKVSNNILFNHFEKYNNKLISQRFEKEDILPKIGKTININSSNAFFHKIISDYKKIFPSKAIKRICYDNEGFYLFEPRSTYIRKGVLTKFKIRIKGALNASLLDGNKWTNLKKIEDEIYEGQKIIETDNVSICCHRGKNVFTEVFKFKPRKNKYDLSHSQGINHTMLKRF